ncbi:uncharacterized protein LOC143037487 isoform X2 [Oratosquilla oratoria]|uniref:uncharacterized protein LOC143037487 isoform X2 n=1 Tax=Oratosquilla oratoria TaxID=337810 RepID=UPI003F76514E
MGFSPMDGFFLAVFLAVCIVAAVTIRCLCNRFCLRRCNRKRMLAADDSIILPGHTQPTITPARQQPHQDAQGQLDLEDAPRGAVYTIYTFPQAHGSPTIAVARGRTPTPEPPKYSSLRPDSPPKYEDLFPADTLPTIYKTPPPPPAIIAAPAEVHVAMRTLPSPPMPSLPSPMPSPTTSASRDGDAPEEPPLYTTIFPTENNAK